PTASRTRRVESDGAGRVPPPGPSGSWRLERSWAPRLLDTLQDVDGLSRFLHGRLRVGLAQEVLLGGGKEGFLDPLPVLDGGRLGDAVLQALNKDLPVPGVEGLQLRFGRHGRDEAQGDVPRG